MNPGLLHCRWILYQLSHQGSPRILEWVAYPFSSRSSQLRNGTRISCIAGEFFTSWATRKGRILKVPWTARRTNQSILKEINPDYSLEGLMLKLKLQSFGHLLRITDSGKDPDAGKDCRQDEKGTTKDEVVGWHHQLNRQESEQTPGDGEGQEIFVCCSSWDCQKSDTNKQMNNHTEGIIQGNDHFILNCSSSLA